MVAGLVLAAGFSSRMGTDKLLLPFGNSTVLETTLDQIANNDIPKLVVVTRQEIANILTTSCETDVVINPFPSRGQSSSLILGIEHIQKKYSNCSGVLVFLGDMPLLSHNVISAVVDGHRRHPDKIVRPFYENKPGHPVAFGSIFFDEFCKSTGDTGGRLLMKNNPQALFTLPGDETCILDMDTPAAYKKGLFYERNRNH